nr:unnamed protein product [Callosobruchus analis]
MFTGFDFSEYVVSSRYSVLGLSETWLNGGTLDSIFDMPNYALVRSDRDGRGGGVAFYIGNQLKFKKFDVPSASRSLEHLWLSLKIEGKCVCVGSLYRPPNTDINSFFEALETTIAHLILEYDIIMFGGDLNIDLNNLSVGATRHLLTLFEKYNIQQIISTRLGSGTLLDLIVTSRPDSIVECHVIGMDGISDHCLVECCTEFKETKQPHLFTTYRNFSKFNQDSFVADLLAIDWMSIYELSDVNEMISFWNDNLTKLFNMHAPVVTARITKPPAPWLTTTLKISNNIVKKALLKYKKSKTESVWKYYQEVRNNHNRAVKAERKAYLQLKSDKDFWKAIEYVNINNKKRDSSQVEFDSDELNNFL